MMEILNMMLLNGWILMVSSKESGSQLIYLRTAWSFWGLFSRFISENLKQPLYRAVFVLLLRHSLSGVFTACPKHSTMLSLLWLVETQATMWAQVAVPLSNSPRAVLPQVVLCWSCENSFCAKTAEFSASRVLYADLWSSFSAHFLLSGNLLSKLQLPWTPISVLMLNNIALLYLYPAWSWANASRQKAWTIIALCSFVPHPSEINLALFTV